MLPAADPMQLLSQQQEADPSMTCWTMSAENKSPPLPCKIICSYCSCCLASSPITYCLPAMILPICQVCRASICITMPPIPGSLDETETKPQMS